MNFNNHCIKQISIKISQINCFEVKIYFASINICNLYLSQTNYLIFKDSKLNVDVNNMSDITLNCHCMWGYYLLYYCMIRSIRALIKSAATFQTPDARTHVHMHANPSEAALCDLSSRIEPRCVAGYRGSTHSYQTAAVVKFVTTCLGNSTPRRQRNCCRTSR